MSKETLFQRNMGAYLIVHRNHEIPSDEGGLMLMKYAETSQGDYIGDTKMAYLLTHKYGIKRFEKAKPSHSVCSIGYNPETKTWYGWSHRAIKGFADKNAKQRARRFAESVS